MSIFFPYYFIFAFSIIDFYQYFFLKYTTKASIKLYFPGRIKKKQIFKTKNLLFFNILV